MAGERGRLREGRPGGQREPDERVPEVVQPDRLATVSVQSCGVTRRVDSAERVAARLRLAAGRGEDERLRVDEPQVKRGGV